jgi:tRNA modification GTPase
MGPPDTIAALATAPGVSALAVVRVSGPAAVALVDACFPARDLVSVPSHTVHVGYFVGAGEDRLDQVVVTVFRAPASATGEDVVEVSCHGGDLAPRLVLRALIDGGARLARPGEFTERAFLNGKLDLAQAEAVADLIHARSTLAHRISLNHLSGRYSGALADLREDLLRVAALIELELDFSEEDVDFVDRQQLRGLLMAACVTLDHLLASYRLGSLAREGVRVVIGGRPNAGKSTLLNALLGYDRAIVSDTPGTTRDALEADLEIGGLLFRFVDTAGLRESEDEIEAEGVRRAEAAASQADVLLYLLDASASPDPAEEEWLTRFTVKHPETPVLLVSNKADLLSGSDSVPPHALALSARRALRESSELDALRTRLLAVIRTDLPDAHGEAVVVSERHRQHLSRAREAVERALAGVEAGRYGELVSLDLRSALREIGAITGEVTTEDVLGAIFSRFCIGK